MDIDELGQDADEEAVIPAGRFSLPRIDQTAHLWHNSRLMIIIIVFAVHNFFMLRGAPE